MCFLTTGSTPGNIHSNNEMEVDVEMKIGNVTVDAADVGNG